MHPSGDIKGIADIEPFDFLLAGFPCQPFSYAGKRQGFGDTRGTLFFEIERILGVYRPKAFLLENVRGLYTHDGGRTFETIMSKLHELGYGTYDLILNSSDFNIPQNRVRLYILGILGHEPQMTLKTNLGASDSHAFKKNVEKMRTVEVDGVLQDKYVRRTREEIDRGMILEVEEDGFEGPKRKPFTYRDDEYDTRYIRTSSSYREYAKDICDNYQLDLRRYKLIKERRQYIGVSGKESFSAMCEDITFLQQSLKTVLADHTEIFRTRYAKGLSVRKAAEELQVNRGVIERRQAALLDAFSQLLYERDQADGACRLRQTSASLDEETETE